MHSENRGTTSTDRPVADGHIDTHATLPGKLLWHDNSPNFHPISQIQRYSTTLALSIARGLQKKSALFLRISSRSANPQTLLLRFSGRFSYCSHSPSCLLTRALIFVESVRVTGLAFMIHPNFIVGQQKPPKIFGLLSPTDTVRCVFFNHYCAPPRAVCANIWKRWVGLSPRLFISVQIALFGLLLTILRQKTRLLASLCIIQRHSSRFVIKTYYCYSLK